MAQFNTIQSQYMIFYGRVQGVGFRFTAQRLANELGLRGWVRNMPDEGAVELFVHGEQGLIAKFTERLKESFTVLDVRVSEAEASSIFTSFEIRY